MDDDLEIEMIEKEGGREKTTKSKIEELLKRKIKSIEDSKTPVLYFFLSFFFAVSIRNFLEASLYLHFYDLSAIFNIGNLIHFFSSYLALAFGITLLFYVALDKPVIKILKIVLPTFIILNVAPIVDFTIRSITGNPGINIGYIIEGDLSNTLTRYLTYFGQFSPQSYGVTIGMKIEILIILILGFSYLYISSSNLLKSAVFTLFLYTIIFWEMIAFPSLLMYVARQLGLNLVAHSTRVLTQSFFIIIFILGTVIFFLYNKTYLKSIIKDIRPYRLIHYESMFFLGIVLAYTFTERTISVHYHIPTFFIIVISIALTWLYSVFINNLEDIPIDTVTNEERPLIKGDIPLITYKKLSWILLFVALIYAYLVSVVFLFLIITYMAGYFLYSAPPFRLKKVPVLSKAIISFNSLVLIIAGYWFVNYSLLTFPVKVVLILMLGFTMALNFIDIKDYEGDKEAGISTLPGLIGLKRSKIVIGISFIITYLSCYFILQDVVFLAPLALLGVLEFYLINKEEYEENLIFIIYLSSLFFLMIILLFY
ncbi:MAG: UbiA family prenyltransferase [Thermoplasmata archaeon]